MAKESATGLKFELHLAPLPEALGPNPWAPDQPQSIVRCEKKKRRLEGAAKRSAPAPEVGIKVKAEQTALGLPQDWIRAALW